METDIEGIGNNGVIDQSCLESSDQEYRSRELNFEFGRSNLDKLYKRMMEIRGMTYQELLEETAKKGDVLFSSIDKGKILDFESLKRLINPKEKRCVRLNGSKQVIIFVENQTAPYFGVRRDTRELLVRTTEFGWTLTGVFF
ncbi:MAG: hypothetical protein U9Q27_00015 [Patescibacteria group bacterium]|nr:hypothetical protein [Patescibacteria group bacterium]